MTHLDSNLFAGNALYYVAAFALVMLILGGVGFLMQRDASAVRMRRLVAQSGSAGTAPTLARTFSDTPRGIAKALIPDDPSEIAQIQFQLAKVGYSHPNAVQHFFVLRLVLAVLPPVLVFGSVALARGGLLPPGMQAAVLEFPRIGLMQIAAICTAAGF